MISAHDLIALSEALLASGTETASRSAVSRAYYACYHQACALADHQLLPLAHAAVAGGAHRQLAGRFEQSPARDLKRIGYMLKDLHNYRTDADYEVHAPFQHTLAKAQVSRAKTLLQDIDSRMLTNAGPKAT